MVKQVMPGTSAAEFRRQMEGQAFTLVDFYAEWCGPCKMIAPQVDQLAMLHPHITFLKACPLLSSPFPFPFCAIAWSCDVGAATLIFFGICGMLPRPPFFPLLPLPLLGRGRVGLSGEGEGSVWWGVLQVDVDQCPDVSGSCSIAAMPTFILFARGKEMSRVTGANPAKLRELLQQATYES